MNPIEHREVYISRKLFQQMQDHVRMCAPEEACGIVAGNLGVGSRIYPVTNITHSPTRFRMEPTEQVKVFLELEAQQMDLIAIYHSHPAGPRFPSMTDLAEFAYPGVLSLIWFPVDEEWDCLAFWINGNQYQETNCWANELQP